MERRQVERVEAVGVGLDAYRGLIGDRHYQELVALGRQLAGLRVVQLNATPRGGGVAELLSSLGPLLQSIGIEDEWYVLTPDVEFFEVTKKMHNLLQGQAGSLTRAERTIYLHRTKRVAEAMRDVQADVWVVHDPQPLPIIGFWRNDRPAIWRCHIDTSRPNDEVKQFLLPYVSRYDRLIFTLAEYVFPGIDPTKVRLIAPALNPFTDKNVPMAKDDARGILRKLGIDPSRPLMTQVSRFDRWKDPLGVIAAYRLAKERIPGLQLALVGVIEAQDDPEAFSVLRKVAHRAAGDPDIHLYSDPHQVGDVEVNAFQTGSEVIVQMSLREGFGLTVAEAMWKGTPVVGRRVGGIALQIRDGEDGFLVSTTEECADRVVALLHDASLARRIGEAGRESVRERYLLPRLACAYLRVFDEVATGAGRGRRIA